jgi:hypothetical protein
MQPRTDRIIQSCRTTPSETRSTQSTEPLGNRLKPCLLGSYSCITVEPAFA